MIFALKAVFGKTNLFLTKFSNFWHQI